MNASPQAPLGTSLPVISAPIMRVQTGTHHDPFEVRATPARRQHPDPRFLPAEAEVAAALTRVTGTDCLSGCRCPVNDRAHLLLRWQDKRGEWHTAQCPYTLPRSWGDGPVPARRGAPFRSLERW
jgi:1,4-alpha-glucan branching enzyme